VIASARNTIFPSDLYSFVDKSSGKPEIRVNGKAVPLNIDKGYAKIKRLWKKGDVVRLDLPMDIRRIAANEKVEADRGKVALQHGPVVYCLEWPDNPGGKVLDLVIPDNAELACEFRKDLLGGVTVIKGKGFSVSEKIGDAEPVKTPREFTAIPYYAWSHRGLGEMTGWPKRR
jgi:DUF1680 family protein